MRERPVKEDAVPTGHGWPEMHMYCAVYDFFRDQGSIIAGLLALAAGIIAYIPVHQQNKWLKRETARKAAYETQIATMRIATELRRWMNRVAEKWYETLNWISSEGHGWIAHGRIPRLPFDRSLEMVALLEHDTARSVFSLLHQRDAANSSIKTTAEIDGDDVPDEFIASAAECWLAALDVFSRMAHELKWTEKAFPEDISANMKDEVARIRKLQAERPGL